MRLNPKILRDPQFNLSSKDQYLLMRRATGKWLTKPFNITLYVTILLGWIGAMLFVPRWLESQGLSSTIAAVVQWAVLYPLMFVSLLCLMYRFRLLKHVYQELRELGHDVCPKCGYTLVDLPESETLCPECGAGRSTMPIESPSSDSTA